MIKVEVIESFTFGDFNKIKDSLIRKDFNKSEEGKLYRGDIFECDQNTCEYLTGTNAKGKVVVKVIEIAPDPVQKVEEQPKKEKKPYQSRKKSPKTVG